MWAAIVLALTVSCDAPDMARPVAPYNPTVLTAGLLFRWEAGRTIRVWTVAAPPSIGFDLGLEIGRAHV